MGEKREARDGSLRDTTIFTALSVQAKTSEGDEVLIPFICYQTVLVLIGPILFLSWGPSCYGRNEAHSYVPNPLKF